MIGNRKKAALNWFLRELGGGGGADTVLSLRMVGGQLATYIDYSPDVITCDVLKRARTFARTANAGDEGTNTIYVTSLTRSANVVSVVLNGPPDQNLATGQLLCLTCFPDTSFSVDQVAITVTDQTHFTYPCAGSNGTAPLATYYDAPAAVLSRVAVGAAGHPIADCTVVLCRTYGSQTSLPALDGTYYGVFPGGLPSNVTVPGGNSGGVLSDYTPGGATFTLTVSGTQSANMTLTFTGVPVDGTFRLPRLIRSDHDQTGATFARPDFAAHLSSRYKVLRTMDLGRTNNNAYIIGSSTRPLLNDGRGMPLEDQIALCNQISADLYYCVPMNASNAYIDAALTLIRDTLSPSLNLYLEFDNEPWNSAFLQYHWHLAATRAAVKGAINGPDGLAEIVSVARVGTTVTVTLSRPPTFASGASVQVTCPSDGTLDTASSVATVSGSTFTYTLGSGDYTVSSVANATVYGDLSHILKSGGTTDIYVMKARWHAWKTYLLSQRASTIFSGLNTRCRVVLEWAMIDYNGRYGALRDNVLPWLTAQFGTVSAWLYMLSGAPYCYATGADDNAAELAASITASMDDNKFYLHQMKWLALKYGLKAGCYEAGDDKNAVPLAATIDSTFSDASYYTASKYLADETVGHGSDLTMIYMGGSMRWSGGSGGVSWGTGGNITDMATLGNATGSAQRQKAIDATLAAPLAITDAYQMPGSVMFRGTPWASDQADDDGECSVSNGMYSLANTSRYVECAFYAPAAGVFNVTIWGKTQGTPNAVRVYVDDVSAGTLALFSDGTAISTGTAGGSASPTALAVTISAAGWHRIKVQSPSSSPTGCGVSKIVSVAA